MTRWAREAFDDSPRRNVKAVRQRNETHVESLDETSVPSSTGATTGHKTTP